MKADLTGLTPAQLRRAKERGQVQSIENYATLLERDPQEQERVSVHEAGHVAMCEILGVPVNQFFGPGLKEKYLKENYNGFHAAAVGHESTRRWGTVDSYVALKQESLISVAGEAAELVVLHDESGTEIRNYEYPEYSDCGIFDGVHSGKWDFPNLSLSQEELDKKWKTDFYAVVAIFSTVDARKVLDNATARFRRFLTTDIHIDLSALKPEHRSDQLVEKAVSELTNKLNGPNAALDKLLKYSAAKAVLLDGLGVKTKFAGPSIRYKTGAAASPTALSDNLGGLTLPSSWIEKLLRSAENKGDTLGKIATVLLIGNAYVYGEADKGYGRENVGESSYTLSNRIQKLYCKYDDKFKSEMDALKAEQQKENEAFQAARLAGKEMSYQNGTWQKRQKLEKDLVEPLRLAAIILAKQDAFKEKVAAKVKEFEQQLSA